MNSAGRRPRRSCPICGKLVAVRVDATLHKHIDRNLQPCRGSNTKTRNIPYIKSPNNPLK